MSVSIEAEVRILVRQVAARATLGGGMDRLTYDALMAASAALTDMSPAGERPGHEEALQAVRARLHACDASA